MAKEIAYRIQPEILKSDIKIIEAFIEETDDGITKTSIARVLSQFIEDIIHLISENHAKSSAISGKDVVLCIKKCLEKQLTTVNGALSDN